MAFYCGYLCMYHSEIVKSVVKNLEETRPCPLAGFEPAIPAIKRSQYYSLDRSANGIGHCFSFTTQKLYAEY
jgi:hypothetical protein